MCAGLWEGMQLHGCASSRRHRGTKSLLSQQHPEPVELCVHSPARGTLQFPSVQPHDLVLAFSQPPCKADCTWIWEGQTHEEHHRITSTPDCRKMNVLPKRRVSLSTVSPSRSFQCSRFVQGQLRKMSTFLSKFPVTGFKF